MPQPDTEPVQQTVSIAMALAGKQDISLDLHQPGSDSAAVGIRIGTTLIHLCDPDILTSFTDAWQRLLPDADRLPLNLGLSDVTSTPGMTEPTVLIKARRGAIVQSQLTGTPGTTASFWVRIGRLTLRVADRKAFLSVLPAVRSAADLATAAFSTHHPDAVTHHALDTARRAFSPSRTARKGPAPAAPSAAAPAALYSPRAAAPAAKPVPHARRSRPQAP